MLLRQSHRPRTVSQNSHHGLLAIVLLAATIACVGCGGDDSSPPAPGDEASAGSGSAAGRPSADGPAQTSLSAEQVLAAMVTAYQEAATYDDQAIVRLTGTVGDQPIDVKSNCLVALQRPDKARLQIDNGVLISDGARLFAFTSDSQGQVLQLPAPAVLTIPAVYPDYLLASAMMQSPAQTFSWAPLQLILLLADDPLKTLLAGVEQTGLLEPEKIDDVWCDRVEIQGPAGQGIFWIDQQSRVLRRFEFPTMAIKQGRAAEQIKDLSLVAEYHQAAINRELPPEAFQFEAPPYVPFVERLVPPILTILGQPMPAFELVDMQGNTVSAASLSGKTVVLEYWQTTNIPCRQILLAVAQTYAKFKDDPEVVFLAVSLDGEAVENVTLEKVLADWNVELPVYRDPGQKSFAPFRAAGVPLTIVVGPKGAIQSFQPGGMPNFSAMMAAVVESVKGGHDVFRASFEQFVRGQKRFDQVRQYAVKTGDYRIPSLTGREVPRAEILARTEPESLKLSPLWTCEELKQPGNMLVIPEADGPPRLLVINQMNSIAELSPDGKLLANHKLELDAQEPITFIRTAVNAEGKRYFVVSARGVQHVYLLDDQFKTLLRYPDAAHAGIGDVQLVDLQGDGGLEIVVGYFGVVGVQAVSLDGTRLWANRSLVNALRVSPLGPDDQGRRGLLCLDGSADRGTMVELDPDGKRLREIVVPDRSVSWITGEDLDGDGRVEICALAQIEPGKSAAIGVDLDGKELWRVPMAAGVHQQQIEAVIGGNALESGPDQWVLSAADGTIQFVSMDGQVVDHFAYGAELAGVATARFGDRVVLLVATPDKIDAWTVEP